MLNNGRLGQELRANAKIFCHPLAWRSISTKLIAGGFSVLTKRKGQRTEQVIQPGLLKESFSSKINLETITVDSPDGLRMLRGLFGRYSCVGTRSKFPRKGSPAEPVRNGTNMNFLSSLKFVYSPKHWELKLFSRYRSEVADISTTW
jgi:hypothetical protein